MALGLPPFVTLHPSIFQSPSRSSRTDPKTSATLPDDRVPPNRFTLFLEFRSAPPLSSPPDPFSSQVDTVTSILLFLPPPWSSSFTDLATFCLSFVWIYPASPFVSPHVAFGLLDPKIPAAVNLFVAQSGIPRSNDPDSSVCCEVVSNFPSFKLCRLPFRPNQSAYLVP